MASVWRDEFRNGRVAGSIREGWARGVAERWLSQNFNENGPTARTLDTLVSSLTTLEKKRDRFETAICQVMVELDLVLRFYRLADELGFDLPDVTHELSYLNQVTQKRSRRFPYREWSARHPTEIHCFAQHHRVPTRLLDWTLSPLVGAFFAVNGWRPEDGDPAVWALDTEMVTANRNVDLPDWKPEDQTLSIEYMTCPRSRHSFLHAQDGMFTWILGADRYYLEHGSYPSVEDAITVHCTAAKSTALRKLVIASAEVPKLARLLSRERITKARLMPALDNVFDNVQMELLWEDE